MKRKGWKIISLSGILFLIPILSSAQSYPTKPINVLVGFAPGGTMDISTRVLASKAEKFLGQPFIISNQTYLKFSPHPSPLP